MTTTTRNEAEPFHAADIPPGRPGSVVEVKSRYETSSVETG